MSGENLERFKKMERMSEEEFLEYDRERIMIKNAPQVLTACSMVCNFFSEEHLLAGAVVFNSGSETSTYTVRILVQDSVPLIFERSIPSGSSKEEWFNSNDGSVVDMLSKGTVKCDISIRDSFGREISSSSGFIRPSTDEGPVQGSISKNTGNDTGEGYPGIVSISSGKGHETSCLLKVLSDDTILHAQAVRIPANGSVNQTIRFKYTICPGGPTHFETVVDMDGHRLFSESPRDVASESECDTRIDSNNIGSILAECSSQRVVDLSDISEGNVVVGAVAVRNDGEDSRIVSIRAFLEGDCIYASNVEISSKSSELVKITVPFKKVSFDDTCSMEMRFQVLSESGGTILDRLLSMIIRSRFDLDLTKIKEQTARMVNPLDPVIKRFIDSVDGPLAKAMGSSYAVTGYQSRDAVVPQIKAVFEAVRSLGMHYVSDTSTLSDEGFYQRVRTPEKVLEDRSGNCIEFSILFASILESMGLEPVVVFPVGHAIVGVVLSTDMYDSCSCMPPVPGDSIVVLRDGRKTCSVLCFESTCCAHRSCSFGDAVGIATDTINDQLSSINRRTDFSLIEEKRQKGIQPKVV